MFSQYKRKVSEVTPDTRNNEPAQTNRNLNAEILDIIKTIEGPVKQRFKKLKSESSELKSQIEQAPFDIPLDPEPNELLECDFYLKQPIILSEEDYQNLDELQLDNDNQILRKYIKDLKAKGRIIQQDLIAMQTYNQDLKQKLEDIKRLEQFAGNELYFNRDDLEDSQSPTPKP